MDNYCAPQWVDFSSSPQVPCDDYFEKCHDIYESNLGTDLIKNNIKVRKRMSEITKTPKQSKDLQVKDFIKSTPNLNENYKMEIDNLKNTPIRVISSTRYSEKHKVLQEVTYDNVLLEAIQNIQLGVNLQKVTKEKDLLPVENVFKKPLPLKNKTTKPISISEKDKSKVPILSNGEETKSKFSNVNMIKRNKNSSIKNRENYHPGMKANNKNIKLKSSTVKQQTPVTQISNVKKENTVNRLVKKQTLLQYNSKDSSTPLKKTTQKNMEVSSSNGVTKGKQIPKSCSSSNNPEKVSYQKKAPFNKIISTVVGNTGSEIIIKKEKILFFDIPIHTKQKKVTQPVPFSFESRDKMKKQLKLDQESNSIKLETASNIKSVSNFNKTQTKGATSFLGNRVVNGKDTTIKQSKQNENFSKCYMQQVTVSKPLKISTALKDNNYQKTAKKINEKKNEDIQNNKGVTNKVQNSFKSISCKNMHINKNSKTHAKEPLQANKCLQKENKQPNINMSTKLSNTLNQNKGITVKNAIVTSTTKDKEKKREIEERIRQRRIMYGEKLKRERETKLAQEKVEIAKLRRQTEIKAKPMPVYMPLIHIKSTKPLTQPQSPAWCNKHRVSRKKETV